MRCSITASELNGEVKFPEWTYDVFGAACTEVELDVLTGNYIIQRMDVLYDSGTR